MATRRKHKKKTHHRRRHRMGALSMSASSPIVKYGSIAAGYLLGDLLNQQLIDKLFGTPTDPVKTGKGIAIGQIGLGAYLSFMKLGRKPKTTIEVVLGGVLLGAGAKRAMVVFKAGATTMSGYGDVPTLGAYKVPGQLGRKVAGYGDVPTIGGYKTPGSLNGAKVMGSMDSVNCEPCSDKTSSSGSTLMG